MVFSGRESDGVGMVMSGSVVSSVPVTVIDTSSVAVAPELSVTVRRKVCVPEVSPVTGVLALVGVVIVADPPESFVHT